MIEFVYFMVPHYGGNWDLFFILFLRKCDDTYGENFSEKVKFNSNVNMGKKIESQHAKRIF